MSESGLGQAIVICMVLLIFIVVMSLFFKMISIKPKATPTSKPKEMTTTKNKEKPILYIILAILFILNIFSIVTINNQHKQIEELKNKISNNTTGISFIKTDIKDIKEDIKSMEYIKKDIEYILFKR